MNWYHIIFGVLDIILGAVVARQLWVDNHKIYAIWVMIISIGYGAGRISNGINK